MSTATTTWLDVGRLAGVPEDNIEEEMEFLLWAATPYPFGTPRDIWYRLRHSLRHQTCIDDPMAMCGSKRRQK
jgi:hypothetical protein